MISLLYKSIYLCLGAHAQARYTVVCLCVCVWKGVSKHKANWLGGTAPAEAYHFDSNGMHINFMKDIQFDKLYIFPVTEEHQSRHC